MAEEKQNNKAKDNQKKKTNKRFTYIIVGMLIVAIVVGTYAYFHSLAHEGTNDAQIKTNMIPVIPHVSGYINEVYVTDNQTIKKGDTLFTIDEGDYRVQLAQAKAQLAQAEGQLAVSKASIGTSEANFITSQSHIGSATGSIETAKIQLKRATDDYERYKKLYENHSITAQKYEMALAAKSQAEQQLEIMKSQKKASVSQSHAAGSQKDISQKQIAVAKAQVESAKAMIDKAKLDLSYTAVTASFDGQLSDVNLKPGQFVAPGQSLFYLVDTQEKWVVANFKETQLSHMKIGQDVDIQADAFPNIIFKGKVRRFSPATGARFSLLPPDNATGNFVKTVQRLPVKITLTDENKSEDLAKLRSGMNVEVDVHIK